MCRVFTLPFLQFSDPRDHLVNATTLARVFMIRSYAEKKAESPQEPSDSWLLRIHCTVDGNWGPLPPSSLETKATQAVSYADMLISPSFIDLSIALISSMRGSMLVPWLWWTLNGRSQWQFNKLPKSLYVAHIKQINQQKQNHLSNHMVVTKIMNFLTLFYVWFSGPYKYSKTWLVTKETKAHKQYHFDWSPWNKSFHYRWYLGIPCWL